MNALRNTLFAGAMIGTATLSGSSAFSEPATQAAATWTVVHAMHVLAEPGTAAPSEASILIRDGQIVRLAPGRVRTDDPEFSGNSVTWIELADAWVLPGLIDSHTHLSFEQSSNRKLQDVVETDAFRTVQAVKNARITIEAGFTTVRNLGVTPQAVFAVRKGIAQGLIPGPRIVSAGEIISPTGGPSDLKGYREDVFPVAAAGVCDGPSACRKLVREEIKAGADVIKVAVTDAVLADSPTGVTQIFMKDEVDEIVATAHLLGRKVAAHAHSAPGIRLAVDAGVDSIEHGTFADDATLKLMASKKIYLVPTLSAGEFVTEKAKTGFLPDTMKQKAEAVGPQLKDTLRRALDAGVPIAFGTDAGVFEHGKNAGEFTYMVQAGMSPAAVLRAATMSAAKLLGVDREIGSLSAGKRADLIAVSADPLKDISVMARVAFVMSDGKVFKDNLSRP